MDIKHLDIDEIERWIAGHKGFEDTEMFRAYKMAGVWLNKIEEIQGGDLRSYNHPPSENEDKTVLEVIDEIPGTGLCLIYWNGVDKNGYPWVPEWCYW